MKINLPQKFSQNDDRWKNATLGTKGTIGAYGCLMTDATMIADWFGANETPLTLNEKMKANGGYQSGNLFVWGAFAKIFGLKYSGQTKTPAEVTKEQMDQIRAAIDKGYPVLLQIDTIPATSALDEHWILAVDYDGDDLIVQDPWDGVQKRITSWGVKPQKLIYAFCWYEGKVPSQQQQQSNETIEIKTTERDWLVGRATTAKEVAEYLEIDNPDQAPTQEYKNVIGGIKSTGTEAKKRLSDKEIELEKANTEIANQKDKLANEEAEWQRSEKLLRGQISALKDSIPDVSKIEGLYKGEIEDLQKKLRDAQKAGGEKDLQITELKKKLEQAEKGIKTKTLLEVIMEFLSNIKIVR